MPPTQRQTIAAIRAIGLSVSLREGEYRVTLGAVDTAKYLAEVHRHAGNITRRDITKAAEAIAYYTDDRQDAIDTARFMVERLPFKVGHNGR